MRKIWHDRQDAEEFVWQPAYSRFRPQGTSTDENVNMTLDQYEAIRLFDPNKCTHEQCAQQMGISRTTVTEISMNLHVIKTAECSAWENTRSISGGNYCFCDGRDTFCCNQTC